MVMGLADYQKMKNRRELMDAYVGKVEEFFWLKGDISSLDPTPATLEMLALETFYLGLKVEMVKKLNAQGV